MKELIEFMARAIVENPDAVQVTEEMDGEHYVYYLKVADEDMGRVIGKQGRIANAMRTMLKVAAIRRGVRAVLEIGDARGGRGLDRRSYGDREDYDQDGDGDAGYDESQEGAHDEGESGDRADEDVSGDRADEDVSYSEDERDDQ